jgi:Na+/proline symporter
MPVGLTGLVLASIFAIAMSNASGSLNSLASSSMLDFHSSTRKESGGATSTAASSATAQRLSNSRRMTLVWGAALAALGLIRWGPVLVAGLTIASITYGGLLGVFLLGTWNRSANENGALIGFLTGILTMIAVWRGTPLAWTWYVLTGTFVTFAVGSLASLAGNAPPKPVAYSSQ